MPSTPAGAAIQGGHVDGMIFHSGRASRYTSTAFADTRTRHGIRRSMGRIGSSYDNWRKPSSPPSSGNRCTAEPAGPARPKPVKPSSARSPSTTTADDTQPSATSATPQDPTAQPGTHVPEGNPDQGGVLGPQAKHQILGHHRPRGCGGRRLASVTQVPDAKRSPSVLWGHLAEDKIEQIRTLAIQRPAPVAGS